MAPNLEGGEVIKNPPALLEVLAKTFPGLNGRAKPRFPFPIPGGSCRINFPLKNGVPCELVDTLMDHRRNEMMRDSGTVGKLCTLP